MIQPGELQAFLSHKSAPTVAKFPSKFSADIRYNHQKKIQIANTIMSSSR